MARKRDRFFALFGAILFLITASAFSIAVIVQLASGNGDPGKTSQDAQSSSSTCEQSSITGTTQAVPAVYKAPGTVSKLEATDLTVGTGTAAAKGSCIQVKYEGSLAQSGTVFQENYSQASLLQTPLGTGQLIPGWDTGMIGMKVGGVRRLVIPAAQGYGSQAQSGIPANSDLVFTVTLVAIKQ